MGKKLTGLETVHRHQSGKRSAMLDIEIFLDKAGFAYLELQIVGDEFAHAPVDLRKEITSGRIKRVVEIENPMLDICKIKRMGPGGRESAGVHDECKVDAGAPFCKARDLPPQVLTQR
jgi:hypothetical protein